MSTDEHACCLECCQREDPRACSEKRAAEPKATIQVSMIATSPRTLPQVVAAQLRRPCLKTDNWGRGRQFPMKGIQLLPTLQKSVHNGGKRPHISCAYHGLLFLCCLVMVVCALRLFNERYIRSEGKQLPVFPDRTCHRLASVLSLIRPIFQETQPPWGQRRWRG